MDFLLEKKSVPRSKSFHLEWLYLQVRKTVAVEK